MRKKQPKTPKKSTIQNYKNTVFQKNLKNPIKKDIQEKHQEKTQISENNQKTPKSKTAISKIPQNNPKFWNFVKETPIQETPIFGNMEKITQKPPSRLQLH